MQADRAGTAAADIAGPDGISRCGCGRLAMARCWLGELSPARWLVFCKGGLPPEAPEAA